MLHKIFTVYDSKSETYLTPFFMKTKGEALRGFIDVAQDDKHQFGKHPEDYTLFEIGEYDDVKCTIISYESKISVGTAIEFLKPKS